jgi:hypothetical protein
MSTLVRLCGSLVFQVFPKPRSDFVGVLVSVHGNRELSGSDDHFVLLLATMVKVARDARTVSTSLGRSRFSQPGFWWRFVNSRLPNARCRPYCNKPGDPDADT